MRITFRGKVRESDFTDGTLATRRIKVPAIKRSHCDMHAFRSSKRFGGYANSDLFPAMLKRELEALGVRDTIDLLVRLPESVTVDTSGFLAEVTIDVPDKV